MKNYINIYIRLFKTHRIIRFGFAMFLLVLLSFLLSFSGVFLPENSNTLFTALVVVVILHARNIIQFKEQGQ